MITVSHRTCNGRRNSSRGDSPRHTDGMLRGLELRSPKEHLHFHESESFLTIWQYEYVLHSASLENIQVEEQELVAIV